jgi:hypothetical protein
MLVPILGGVFALVGGCMSVLAARQWSRQWDFVRVSTRTDGTVVELRQDREQVETVHFPRIRFETPAGREIVFESGMGSSLSKWSVGDAVPVRYRPDRPNSAEIDSFLALWGVTMLFGLLGGAFLFIGLGLLLDLVPV